MVTTSKPGTGRSFWWAPGVLFAALTAFYLFFIVDRSWHQGWDSATYLLTARNLAPDGIYAVRPAVFSPATRIHVLPVLVDWRKRAASFLSAQHIDGLARISGACSDLCRVPSRYGGLPAAAATLLFATSPLFISHFNLVLSEFLFLLLLYTGIWLLLPPADGVRTSAIKRLAGLLVVTAAIYVRTIGLGLLPGIAVQSFRAKRLAGVAELVLVVALLLPWFQFTAHAAATLPRPATQLETFDYKTGLFHVDPGDPTSPLLGPDGWVKRIISNTKQLMQELGRNVLHSARELRPSSRR